MSITSRQGEDRRTQVLEFVADFWTANGYAPTIREVARGVGLSHPSSAHYHVLALERAGLLQSTPGTMRSLRVVQQAVEQ